MSPRELALAQAALRKLPVAPPKKKTRAPVVRRPYGSLPTGVHESGGSFQVHFRRKAGTRYLGTYPTVEEAAAVAAKFDAENPALFKLVPWTRAEEDTLRELAGRVPGKEIAAKLGRTLHSVYNRAIKLGISTRVRASRRFKKS